MNKYVAAGLIVTGVGAAFVLPALLRAAARRPELLHRGADAIENGRRHVTKYAVNEAKRAFGNLLLGHGRK